MMTEQLSIITKKKPRMSLMCITSYIY